MNGDYVAGFMAKAAELGVAPEALAKTAARGDQLIKLINRMSEHFAPLPGPRIQLPASFPPRRPRHGELDFNKLKEIAYGLDEFDLAPAALRQHPRSFAGSPPRSSSPRTQGDLPAQMRSLLNIERDSAHTKRITDAGGPQRDKLRAALRGPNMFRP